MSANFPKDARLRSRADYQAMAYSKRLVGTWILVDYRPAGLQTRMGITVSKRFGNAPQRNRFKRLVREAFRQVRSSFPKGYDLNIRPRTAANSAALSHIQKDFEYIKAQL